MDNSQKNFYELKSKDYVDWLIDLVMTTPTKMLTEKTYSNVFKNGTHVDKLNLLRLEQFARSLNEYAIDNCINTHTEYASDIEYTIHFSLVLKVNDMCLLIESASSTFSSYTFVTIMESCNGMDYIDWDLYSEGKRPSKIEKIVSELNTISDQLNLQIADILNKDLFMHSGLSEENKKEIITKYIINNLKLDSVR